MTEDLSVLFDDFGVTVSWTTVTALGLLDKPDLIEDQIVAATDYVLTVQTDVFSGLANGASLTVDGTAYTVRGAPRKIDDGKLMKVSLSKT